MNNESVSREKLVTDVKDGRQDAADLVRAHAPDETERVSGLRPTPAERAEFQPGFTRRHARVMQAAPGRHGARSGTLMVIHHARRRVLMGGTR